MKLYTVMATKSNTELETIMLAYRNFRTCKEAVKFKDTLTTEYNYYKA